MPSLQTILEDTMLFSSTSKRTPLDAGAKITCDTPNPTVPSDPSDPFLPLILTNPVWEWQHDPDKPNEVTNITSLVRGMDMNYKMAMPVCERIAVSEVVVRVSELDAQVSLPLTKDFVVEKYYIKKGYIPPALQLGFWRLETEVDQSLLVVFAYDLVTPTKPKPFTVGQIEKLGDSFMPVADKYYKFIEVEVGDKAKALIIPTRIVVCFSLTCCKERPDFEGGAVLGVNRIYPHVMVMSSHKLDSLDATIEVERPAKTPHTAMPQPGGIPGDPDKMSPTIGPIFTTDRNDIFTLVPSATWDALFDYVELDPIGNGVSSVIMVDPISRGNLRYLKDAVQNLVPLGDGKYEYRSRDLVKQPRQGDFDNIHVAPKMLVPSSSIKADFYAKYGMGSVSMAPFCIHDCLHMHTRWGKLSSSLETPKKFTLGFDDSYQPCSVEGAPLVPHDQRVRIQLFSPCKFSYSASIDSTTVDSSKPLKNAPPGKAPIVRPGRWHVVMHHGMGYANEIWDKPKVSLARSTVELTGTPDLRPVTADISWSLFYWRLRWDGSQTPFERIVVKDPAKCRDC